MGSNPPRVPAMGWAAQFMEDLLHKPKVVCHSTCKPSFSSSESPSHDHSVACNCGHVYPGKENYLVWSDNTVTRTYREHMSLLIPPGNSSSPASSFRLSRAMIKKISALAECRGLEFASERIKAVKAARSLIERALAEVLLEQQQMSAAAANGGHGHLTSALWAAVRERGCQFLGPGMQEGVLKLILRALEDGSALSRKVLVMFVVQKLSPHYPHASKTAIGHVVQLLYRASCFVVSRRDGDSSLMQLREEFRSYESLRREHDSQLAAIARDARIRITPEQWSSLLYGDNAHTSHMQSIVDRLPPLSITEIVNDLVDHAQQRVYPALEDLLSELRVPFQVLEKPLSGEVTQDPAVFLTYINAVIITVRACFRFLKNHSQRREAMRKSCPLPNAVSLDGCRSHRMKSAVADLTTAVYQPSQAKRLLQQTQNAHCSVIQ